LWDFTGGDEISVKKIVEQTVEHNDTGITILGGEPLDQSEETLRLIECCHETGLDIMVYTGYEMNELEETKLKCVQDADIVIIGRYIDSLRSEELLWRGSTNQKIIWNSTIPPEIDLSERRQTEIHFDSKGKVKILGYPSEKTLTELEKRHGRLRSLTRDI
jgi:anaerobic ribonucleoside-triphosphate reductase activating protein|tara:strand:- start:2389 stop:2871 length:483 start_codon:yes stop_codon:yes gene_type:complete